MFSIFGNLSKFPAITAALIRIKPETGVKQQQAAAEECHQDTANSFTCDYNCQQTFVKFHTARRRPTRHTYPLEFL